MSEDKYAFLNFRDNQENKHINSKKLKEKKSRTVFSKAPTKSCNQFKKQK